MGYGPFVPKVAVVRMLPGLGDLLCAVPALHGLRTAISDSHVTFIGRRSSRWFAERYGRLIDDWIGCDWCPGLVESDDDPAALARVIGEARARHFDVAVQMHGDGRATNAFTASLGARRWGGLSIGDPVLGGHEIDRCVEALGAAGIDVRPGPLDFPLDPVDRRPSLVDTDRFAVLHVGGTRPDRRWPASSFAGLADALLERVDAVVLTGDSDERDVTRLVRRSVRSPERDRVLDVAGSTSIGSLAVLLAAACVVVSNDTGVAHLAAAVDAPTVTVFATADHHRWRARGTHCCSVGHPGHWPTAGEVLFAADALLDRAMTC